MDADRENPPLAVIATGSGRYSDPWHPFDETSAALASILEADGWQITAVTDPDHALAELRNANLLVVNAGDPSRNVPESLARVPAATIEAADTGLTEAIRRGIGVLAVHTSVSSLRDYPAWLDAIGGSWEPGVSWHPPIAHSAVRVIDTGHPITAGVEDFTLHDEMYSGLVLTSEVQVLAEHSLDGVAHPLVWTKENPTRAVVSALGHDAGAYESPELRALIARAARWAAHRAS
ncbi:ThuA domain-containing protein [Microbacterium sp. NPDC076911]|uniref:ThuA domain-containing protein n=1 Tax=Microbacterium sp. NPDC076911 TaxID=3154958 RepID=UPI00343FCC30